MKTMTLRGVESELAEKLKRLAQTEGKSVNQVILDSLRERCGLHKEKKYTRVHHDLDHLFGRWTQAEWEAVQGRIDEERTIDRELWQHEQDAH